MTRGVANIVWSGGLGLVLLLLGALSAGCDARDAAAAAPKGATAPAEAVRELAAKASAAKVKRGEYLVTIGGCNDCHTPWKEGPNGPEPDLTRMLSGHPDTYPITAVAQPPNGPWTSGIVIAPMMTSFSGAWGVSFAANLTPDQNTGLGIWTEDMFMKAIRTGKHWGVSRPILPPMPWFNYRHMTDDDLKAVFAYLRSIPPVKNRVPEPIPPPETTH